MYIAFIKEWLLEGIPKPFVLESLYVPEEPIEYLRWSINKLDTNKVEELTYLDYSINLSLSVEDFETFFYYIDIATRFTHNRSDTKDDVYPWNANTVTFIELRHGCKRKYTSFKEIVKIFRVKVLELLTAIDQSNDADKYYTIKRWRGLILDLTTISDGLVERTQR